jgi:hypothetical protein
MATGETPEVQPTVVPESPLALTQDDKLWGMLAHLLSLAGLVVPFGNIIAPLVVWLMKKDTSRYVDYHGKESLNFQINVVVYLVVCFALFCLVIGVFLLPVVIVYSIVVPIVAAVKANQGEYFKYPFIFRVL